MKVTFCHEIDIPLAPGVITVEFKADVDTNEWGRACADNITHNSAKWVNLINRYIRNNEDLLSELAAEAAEMSGVDPDEKYDSRLDNY